MPEEVIISVSVNNSDFQAVAIMPNDLPEKSFEPLIKEFPVKGINKSVRYIKVEAKNIGICPDWHKGAGEKAWIFVDEITIE